MPVDINKRYTCFEGLSCQEWEEFLKNAESIGWKEAIGVHIKNLDHAYIFDEKRGDWSFLLPLDKDKSVVLDAGSGWGAIIFSLQSMSKKMVALDLFHRKSRFIKIRCQQEDSHNIEPLTGNVQELPFADNSFDLVILNGVLEWTALFDSNRSPLSIQQEVLKETYRVLKKDGYLFSKGRDT